MDQDVVLQVAIKDDIPALVNFLGELFSLEKDFSSNPEIQTSGLSLVFNNPSLATIYLIEIGDEIAGMVALHLSISTAEGGWSGRLEDLYIKPEFRRHGIGTQVVKKLFDIAKQKGLKRITLIADKDNQPALEFYAKCGFERMNLVSFIKRIED